MSWLWWGMRSKKDGLCWDADSNPLIDGALLKTDLTSPAAQSMNIVWATDGV
jgi:hypothetical protein